VCARAAASVSRDGRSVTFCLSVLGSLFTSVFLSLRLLDARNSVSFVFSVKLVATCFPKKGEIDDQESELYCVIRVYFLCVYIFPLLPLLS
jgi:hypothetical protein